MGIKVLSLFDGISCGMVALERAGIKVDRYVAYEIDKNAIKISKHNYPNIEHMGDVTTADFTQYKDFDLLIGGSPCQDLSPCKQKKGGLEGKKSSLFYDYLKAKETIIPKFFLLENVVPKTSDKNIITGHMGVDPVFINSADFCAQTRQRLYWTNIKIEAKPNKNEYVIKDILEKKATWTDKIPKWMLGKWGKKTRFDMLKSTEQKAHCLLASMSKGKICSYVKNKDLIHKLTPLECERLQTLPTWEINLEVELWLDQAKNYVNAVEKNPKLQKLVLNVEKNLPKEFVNFVEKNTNASHLLIKYIAQKNVGMLTRKPTNECTNHKQIELNLNANNVANCMKSQNQELEVPSVHWNVSTNTTPETIQHNGREGYLQKDRLYITLMNGGEPLKLYGKEIMQLVKDVEKNSLTKMSNNSIYTTLSRLGTKNIEQILIICYFYAKSVIDGYIANQTQKSNLLMNFNCAYTNGISNSHRYSCIGNGWTVDVIAYIFKNMEV